MVLEIALIEYEENVRNKMNYQTITQKLHLIVQNSLTSIEEQLEHPHTAAALEVILPILK